MNIVLVAPEIPPNTGNVARLCAAAKAKLHLIDPLGFKLDDRQLKRAGLDYWEYVDWVRWPDWARFRCAVPDGAKIWLIESGGGRHYADVAYGENDYLVFGRETAGLPGALLEANPETWLRIPICEPRARSLNLSNCVALVLYEAMRQQGFSGESGSGAREETPGSGVFI